MDTGPVASITFQTFCKSKIIQNKKLRMIKIDTNETYILNYIRVF